MKRFKITLDEKTASWLRDHATDRGTSVSHVLSGLLQQHRSRMREYDDAKRKFQAIEPFQARWVSGHRPTRVELYADLPRHGLPQLNGPQRERRRRRSQCP